MTISLYRKYRPVRFEEVVGQEHVTRTLINAIKQGRVSHAYLFAGPRGTGKTTCAKILAMALNCESGEGRATPTPDGICPRCMAIRRGESLDVQEIDAASNRGIDDIREIRDSVSFAPVEGRMRVYIVDEVHMLTNEAFNALLKTLEEPPAHALFVLATTEPHKVPATILSRCQRFDFRRPSLEEITRVLKNVAKQENIDVAEATLAVVARAASGSFRDAIGILDQLATFCEGQISMQEALAILGLTQQDLLFEAVDLIAERDTKGAFLFVDRLAQQGADFNQFVRDMLAHLRDLYLVQHMQTVPASLATTAEYADLLASQANRVSEIEIVRAVETLGSVQRSIRDGADARLELELAFLKLTRPNLDITAQALASRVQQLEEQLFRTSAAPPTDIGGPPEALVSEPPARSIDIETIRRTWPILLERINARNKPVLYSALLQGRPESLDNGVLTIRFPAGSELQESHVHLPESFGVLIEELEALTGQKIDVTTYVSKEPEPAEQEIRSVRMLKASELIEHLRREFGATLIEGPTKPKAGEGGS